MEPDIKFTGISNRYGEDYANFQIDNVSYDYAMSPRKLGILVWMKDNQKLNDLVLLNYAKKHSYETYKNGIKLVKEDIDEITAYHGTSSGKFKEFKSSVVYLSTDPQEAETFATNPIIGGGRGKEDARLMTVDVPDGRYKDIDSIVLDCIMNDGDLDETIEKEASIARKEGYSYMTFMHPGIGDNNFQVIVALYPDKLKVTDSTRIDEVIRKKAFFIQTRNIKKDYGNARIREILATSIIEVFFKRRIWPVKKPTYQKSPFRRMMCTSNFDFIKNNSALFQWQTPRSRREKDWYTSRGLCIVWDLIVKKFRMVSLDDYDIINVYKVKAKTDQARFIDYYKNLLKREGRMKIMGFFNN
jgi:hypothetical protein